MKKLSFFFTKIGTSSRKVNSKGPSLAKTSQLEDQFAVIFVIVAWPGVKYETFFSKNVCLHKIRTAAGFWSQNTKSSVNDFLKPGDGKVFFHEYLHF